MSEQIIGKAHRLGILGGGQLGRMFIQSAISYGIDVYILDNDKNAPCYHLATEFTLGNINDYNDVLNFGLDKDVVTVEIENVNIEALYELEKRGVKVFPQPRVLEIIKDKGRQKEFYAQNAIPTAPFRLLEANPNTRELEKHVPFVQKLRTGGYDGRGVQVMRSKEDLQKSFIEPSVMEELIPFTKELSVIVVRNENNETAVYPTIECEFNEANLVEYLFSPAEISFETEHRARVMAIEVINKLGMVGILAVEMFLTKDGQVLVNEIAPRPHNSGHHTIECNITSQFEQHLRSVLNLPLGSTEMTQAGAMLNLLGENGYSGTARYEGLDEILSQTGIHLHLYGKSETKPNRKMGHITITGPDIHTVKERTRAVKGKLRIIS